jgi:tRNA pseudouridine38-40 synthase
MPAFTITLAYDGTGFVGWQRQASGVSIQGLLEEALRELDGRPVAAAGAGRTDAGVHARGQVASFSLERQADASTVVRALNARLPPEVRVLSAAEAPADFHARFGARSKTYHYRIWNGDVVSPFERRYVWHVPGALDVDAMRDAARRIEGAHDFAAFQAAGSDAPTTERLVLSSRISIRDPRSAILVYEITGTGFLRHMVRAIAGSLVDVGRGRFPPSWIDEVIASRDRATAGRTAPAHGLFLMSVQYDATSPATPETPVADEA